MSQSVTYFLDDLGLDDLGLLDFCVDDFDSFSACLPVSSVYATNALDISVSWTCIVGRC